MLRSLLICHPPFVRRRDRPPRRDLSARLLCSLQNDGLSAQHIITLGWRGASDARIRERLQDDQVVFLTQDEDFLLGVASRAIVVLSRVRQSRPLKDRIEIWRQCIRELLPTSKPE